MSRIGCSNSSVAAFRVVGSAVFSIFLPVFSRMFKTSGPRVAIPYSSRVHFYTSRLRCSLVHVALA